jgi:hypothetical protein
MELTQEEIKWIKDRYAEENNMRVGIEKDKLIQQARETVAKRYEAQLALCTQEGRLEERKALIEQITQEANAAELAIVE